MYENKCSRVTYPGGPDTQETAVYCFRASSQRSLLSDREETGAGVASQVSVSLNTTSAETVVQGTQRTTTKAPRVQNTVGPSMVHGKTTLADKLIAGGSSTQVSQLGQVVKVEADGDVGGAAPRNPRKDR